MYYLMKLGICICVYSRIRRTALKISYGDVSNFQKSQVTFKGAFSLNHCIVSVCSLVMGLCSHDLVSHN